jgi:hypothetical protein
LAIHQAVAVYAGLRSVEYRLRVHTVRIQRHGTAFRIGQVYGVKFVLFIRVDRGEHYALFEAVSQSGFE